MNKHIIGIGVFMWTRGERVTDRYGAIYLNTEPGLDCEEVAPLDFASLIGRHGELQATILEARQSPHIGDIARGIAPPNEPLPVGTTLIFGAGRLFTENEEGFPVVGVKPLNDRENDWLDPHELYKLHNQTVELAFLYPEV